MAITEHSGQERTVRQDLGYDLDPSALAPLPPTAGVPKPDETTPPKVIVELEPKPLREWELDETTKAVGRRGVAYARAALRSSRGKYSNTRR